MASQLNFCITNFPVTLNKESILKKLVFVSFGTEMLGDLSNQLSSFLFIRYMAKEEGRRRKKIFSISYKYCTLLFYNGLGKGYEKLINIIFHTSFSIHSIVSWENFLSSL